MPTPSSIDEYLSGIPEEMRDALERLRATIGAAAPDAVEAISYQMPAFKYRGRVLVYFAAFKDHLSLFPASGQVLDRFEAELGAHRTSKGPIQFSPTDPLLEGLVEHAVT